jgi:hypothetical protein
MKKTDVSDPSSCSISEVHLEKARKSRSVRRVLSSSHVDPSIDDFWIALEASINDSSDICLANDWFDICRFQGRIECQLVYTKLSECPVRFDRNESEKRMFFRTIVCLPRLTPYPKRTIISLLVATTKIFCSLRNFRKAPELVNVRP